MPALTALIPYAHVADVARSLAFYALLGLHEVSRYEAAGARLVWAHAATPDGRARVMLALADGPVAPEAQAILFYCWVRDVRALRDELTAAGVDVGPIEHPHSMPAGEIRVLDPDGYVVLVGQLDPA